MLIFLTITTTQRKQEIQTGTLIALAGFRINLGKTYKVIEPVVAPAPEPVPVVEEKKVEPAPVPVPVEVKKEPIRRDVFFKINSAKDRYGRGV